MDQEPSQRKPPPLPALRPVGNPYGAPLAQPESEKRLPLGEGSKAKKSRKPKSSGLDLALPESDAASLWKPRIGLRALELFCQRVGIAIRSGVDVLRILDMEKKSGGSTYRRVMGDLQDRVKNGESLAEAMSNANGYFPLLLVQMVHAGELAGGLDRIFAHMSEYYYELRMARNEFWSQLTWPIIQLGIALGVITVMIALQGMFATGPAEMQFDALGLGLRGSSGVMVFWTWVLFAFGLIFGLIHLVRSNFLQCHRWMLPLILRVPVIGSVFINTALARLTVTLSMLLNAGVDAIRCVRQSFLSTGNDYFMQGLPAAVASVEQGESLAVSYEAAKVLPMEFIQAVEVGELSGNESESLERLASEYQRRAKAALTQLSYIASTVVWLMIAAVIIFFIFRIALRYLGMVNEALNMGP